MWWIIGGILLIVCLLPKSGRKEKQPISLDEMMLFDAVDDD